MHRPLLTLLLLSLPAAACAQPTACAVAAAGYDGPCYYGALPAYFDDFAYTSAALPAPSPGSLFGANAWALRDGEALTRAWYRYNYADLPVPGEIAFEAPSVLTLRLPEGLPADAMTREPAIQSGASMAAGTYHWRVRLSALWPGQWVRHAAWLYATEQFYFDRVTPADTTRYAYAAELDFENENHFEGEHTARGYTPDFVARMSVTNLVGQRLGGGEPQRLSHEGPAAWDDGHGNLVRNGPALYDVSRAAPVAEWAGRWVDLLLVVDDAARTVTYRMLPAEPRPGDPLGPVAARAVTVGEAFYPASPLAAMLSLHWIHPEGRLARALTLEADWFYHTPVVGLSEAEVLAQVARLRARALPRVNTTGLPTFEPRNEPARTAARIEGPDLAACGRPATWALRAWPGGTSYRASYRYRVLPARGAPGAWEPVYAPSLTLTPERGQAGVELEAAVQHVWAPHGADTLPGGWHVPRPGNYAAAARRTVRFDCGG